MRHLLLIVVLSLPLPAAAQDHSHGHRSPYAGAQDRSVKAFTPEQVADLEAGRGMGLALPAELNGYPGPMHVLELAEKLALTPEQRVRTEAVFAAMRAEARRTGSAVLDAERRLDALFATGRATPETLATALADAGALQAELRRVHLAAHLEMVRVLSPDQVRQYGILRGYAR